MKIGFYAGSFDPFTLGHLEIVKKASTLFDKVIIGIGINNSKNRKFNALLMKNAINLLLKDEKIENVECVTYDGMTAEVAKAYKADYLVRGIRNEKDFTYEEEIAKINHKLFNVDTIYLRATNYNYISSSMVRELISFNKDVGAFVPKFVTGVISISTL